MLNNSTGTRKDRLNNHSLPRFVGTGWLFLLLCFAFPAAKAQVPDVIESKIGPGVRSMVENEGSARVVLALSYRENAPQSVSSMVGEVSSSLAMVLPIVRAHSTGSVQTFSAIPAVFCTVISQQDITEIALQQRVLKIDLDLDGVASLADSVPLIDADERHTVGNRGTGVVVAVLDSGIDQDHPNLANRLVNEACFADTDPNDDPDDGSCPDGSNNQIGSGSATDDEGHGTHVAGIIASVGASGSVGVAPDTSIVAVKVIHEQIFSSLSQILNGLQYIIDNPQLNVQVINMSLSTNARFPGICDNISAGTVAMNAAAETLRNRGVITFAASGNDADIGMGIPACLSEVVAVGASDDNDQPASFTNSNSFTDMYAPGVGIISSGLAGSITALSGTSMAAPHAAGCAALLIESGDAVTPQEIYDRLRTSSVQITDRGNVFPRIDCGLDPTLAPTSVPTDTPMTPVPTPLTLEPTSITPEPTPFTPEPTPFTPEPTPFTPEPTPFTPEPTFIPPATPRPTFNMKKWKGKGKGLVKGKGIKGKGTKSKGTKGKGTKGKSMSKSKGKSKLLSAKRKGMTKGKIMYARMTKGKSQNKGKGYKGMDIFRMKKTWKMNLRQRG